MKVTIEFPDGPRTYEADWLEVTRLVAGVSGFPDVDVEPGAERTRIRACRAFGERHVEVSGPTLAEACAKFCRQVSS